MRPTLFTVDQPGPGQLSTMAKPRGGDWLTDEMTALRTAGVNILVCALTTPELHEVERARGLTVPDTAPQREWPTELLKRAHQLDKIRFHRMMRLTAPSTLPELQTSASPLWTASS
ncbi:hypothetical protein GCM10010399_18090 [Dactylosporangium fulvum]|uniref:Uncharacterized protein n=1 Tax=Dactylosporangium fulvum TaxID=53359 RepID=A0ABY5VX46_9ACTN|nr:hypothetical protein [Dactylosporangium fulvum]UWP80366.1 hypothetical protein Dfulv_35120 [Dactylosporangium fulvum]